MIMIRYCNPNQLDNTFRSFQENFSVVQYRYISYNIALIEGDQTGTDIAVPINYPLEGLGSFRSESEYLGQVRIESEHPNLDSISCISHNEIEISQVC